MTDKIVHEVSFKANAIQRDFIMSRAEADLFASRVGEGKSAGLCWAIYHHAERNPGANWALIRDTWENMRRTTQKEFFSWFPPGVMGVYKEGTKTFTWAVKEMRGEVVFLGLDDKKDASKLQSLTLAGVAYDEAAPVEDSGGIDEAIFDMGLSRLRQKDMNWYSCKVAENNPDESHWSYRRFVDPGCPGFRVWQTRDPENSKNLPRDYYAKLRSHWAHRPDMVKRLIEGKFGFNRKGKSVTPEWSDELHLAVGLGPVRGADLLLSWDGGLTPTCTICQVTPLGHLYVLESHVGEDIGALELIEGVVKPTLAEHYQAFSWRHTGDPNCASKEQSSSDTSMVKVIRRELGGRWTPGPMSIAGRVEPLRKVLSRTVSGMGVVRVDREKAKPVWHALRGGWHYSVSKGGVVSDEPLKNEHSHPGDTMGYVAAFAFPMGRLRGQRDFGPASLRFPKYFKRGGSLGFERPGMTLPKDGARIGKG